MMRILLMTALIVATNGCLFSGGSFIGYRFKLLGKNPPATGKIREELSARYLPSKKFPTGTESAPNCDVRESKVYSDCLIAICSQKTEIMVIAHYRVLSPDDPVETERLRGDRIFDEHMEAVLKVEGYLKSERIRFERVGPSPYDWRGLLK
jgi:hypothetical protein